MLAEFEWVSMKLMKAILLLNLVALLMTELKSSCYNVGFFDIFDISLATVCTIGHFSLCFPSSLWELVSDFLLIFLKSDQKANMETLSRNRWKLLELQEAAEEHQPSEEYI